MEIQRLQQQLQKQIEENRVLQANYNALHSKYDTLDGNYLKLMQRLSALESQGKQENSSRAPINDTTTTNEVLISEMKGEVVSASSSITGLQKVWSAVDTKLNNNINELEDLKQYGMKNSLIIEGLDDIPSNKHGLDFSIYVLDKLQELIPSAADTLKIEDIDTSHPLPSKKKTRVIVKFVRRDIKNYIFFKKRELKNSPLKIVITEHLSPRNLWLLAEVRAMVGWRNAWSSQCVVFALVNGKKKSVRGIGDLDYVHHKMNIRASPSTEQSISGKTPPVMNADAKSSLPLQQEDIHLSQTGALTTLTDFQKSASYSNTDNNNLASDAIAKS